MSQQRIFDKFCAAAPFAVLVQLLARESISSDFQKIFDDHRGRQYDDKLLFPAMGNAIADVVLGLCKSPNKAYEKHRKSLRVARSTFYDKLNCTSHELSEAVVAFSGDQTKELQDSLGYQQWDGLDGYRLLALDGNHLQHTDKRLKPLRDIEQAALPGTAVARFDLGRQIFDRVYLLPDAHLQESTCCDAVVSDLNEKDVIVADRHFCIVAFLEAIDVKGAGFIIRHHGRLKGELLGKRRCLGRTDTGVVYEQQFKPSKTSDLTIRRITIELDEPTQDGDTEVHVLTNLPDTICGKHIVQLYPRRWDEEYGFYYLKTCYNSELKSIGHPLAALFIFAMTVYSYNIFQIIKATLYTEHDEDDVENLSHYNISCEIATNTPGMLIVLEDEDWIGLAPRSQAGLTRLLRQIAASIPIENYRKSKRGPKKPKKRKANQKSKHASTGRLLGLTR